ncbi:unnamed protein product [Dovyalis caffra]|uniref:Uncharacterized protein n=1 Tax=Dovyalis caffra TaxID=77055 RepID=A0AAV1RCS1_9ROSI|nr:unnamed protein product [Dovyalis caffra]
MTLPALTSTTITTTALPHHPNTKQPPYTTHHQDQTQSLNRDFKRPNLSLKQISNKSSIDPVVSWTSSISRQCRNGQLHQAASQLTQMRLLEISPNHVTFITLLSCCADFPSQGKSFGPLLHAYVRKLGFDTCNLMVGTALVDMYAKCGHVDLASVCFDELKEKNSVSWNTMIDGFMRNGKIREAIKLFDEMPERGVISWTVLIDGFVKKGHFEEALKCFRKMQVSKVEPDRVTIVTVLSACANLGALGLGLWAHRYALKKGFRSDVKISNSLIDMYSRCGSAELARQVFEKMGERTLVSWNSIIGGLAANGFTEEALEHFDLMQKQGLKPNGVSFTGALTACSHAGLVDEGLKYFDIMERVHKISPRIEHYGCIVDLFSRAGRLEDAMDVIENMPMKPNEVVVGSLLAACRIYGDVKLAERLMNHLVDLDPGADSNYVLLSNIYAAVGRWDGACKQRMAMKALGIQKKPGFSSIEIGCDIHEFVAGDKSHNEAEHIYSMLELLCFDLTSCGYVPQAIAKYQEMAEASSNTRRCKEIEEQWSCFFKGRGVANMLMDGFSVCNKILILCEAFKVVIFVHARRNGILVSDSMDKQAFESELAPLDSILGSRIINGSLLCMFYVGFRASAYMKRSWSAKSMVLAESCLWYLMEPDSVLILGSPLLVGNTGYCILIQFNVWSNLDHGYMDSL